MNPKFRVAGFSIGFCVLCSMQGWADSFQPMSLHIDAAMTGSQPQVNEAEKDQYISRGQEYLRNYFRDQMLTPLISQWFTVDAQTMKAGVAIDVKDIYQAIPTPWSMYMKVYADEEITRYLSCGRFLPVELEMDSCLIVSPQLQFQAKFAAPFNDFMSLQLGSQFNLTEQVSYSVQYRMRANDQAHEGLSMGMGWSLTDWRWNYLYEINEQFVTMQYFSIVTTF